MYEILDSAGINIIRVGLKSSDIMAGETAFHPAFRQLVEGSIARDRLEMQLAALLACPAAPDPAEPIHSRAICRPDKRSPAAALPRRRFLCKHKVLQSSLRTPRLQPRVFRREISEHCDPLCLR